MDPKTQASEQVKKDDDLKKAKDRILLLIRNRQGIVFNEEVKALSSINERGPFDVLPEHANFISIIKENLIIHKKEGSKQEMKIPSGILRVHENRIEVYLEVSVQTETNS